MVSATSWPYAPTFWIGVAPTLPGIPERASSPIQPCRTALATKGSHGSPAATVTTAPPQVSSCTSTPVVSMRTAVPSKPASATTRLLPPATSSRGVPVRSASRTAPRRSCSVRACTRWVAGPPRRRVVRSARRSGTQHRPRHPEHLLAGRGDLEGDVDAVLGDVLDAAAYHDLGAALVVGDDHGLGELAAELADPARSAGPGVEGTGGQREGVHPVRDDPGQPDRPGHPVRPVDRVEIAARAGVPDQVGAGHGVGLLGKLVPGLPGAHASGPRWTRVA